MNIKRKPDWLKVDFRSAGNYSVVSKSLKHNCLNTICVSGRCPNLAECWSRGTATFMILGDICTRSCRFCNTKTGKPLPPNPDEPNKLANSVKELKLKYIVLTSVDRDDLQDGGAEHWAKCILEVKEENPLSHIEVLIPDFQGNTDLIDTVISAKPDVIAHNIETIRRLTPKVRSAAKFDTSLAVLKHVADSGITAKSGFMLGLGETESEILETMDALLENGCKILTVGQYLQPTKKHLEVVDYITPEKFDEYRQTALQKGFRYVESGALVRSSYHAEKGMSI
jgi:lipoic acid synthetase